MRDITYMLNELRLAIVADVKSMLVTAPGPENKEMHTAYPADLPCSSSAWPAASSLASSTSCVVPSRVAIGSPASSASRCPGLSSSPPSLAALPSCTAPPTTSARSPPSSTSRRPELSVAPDPQLRVPVLSTMPSPAVPTSRRPKLCTPCTPAPPSTQARSPSPAMSMCSSEAARSVSSHASASETFASGSEGSSLSGLTSDECAVLRAGFSLIAKSRMNRCQFAEVMLHLQSHGTPLPRKTVQFALKRFCTVGVLAELAIAKHRYLVRPVGSYLM